MLYYSNLEYKYPESLCISSYTFLSKSYNIRGFIRKESKTLNAEHRGVTFFMLFLNITNDFLLLMLKDSDQLFSRTIYVKNMVCHCCIQLIREHLERAGIEVKEISPGKAAISYNELVISHDDIRRVLNEAGTDLIEGRDKIIVEQIKQAIFELIHQMNNMDSIIRKSEYLVEKTGLSYSYLSRIFSSQENITLEKYIILNKIERSKELIDQDEFTLSEIAFMMDYSSVQYLSNQFKQITGMTVSDYKESDRSSKKSLDSLY